MSFWTLVIFNTPDLYPLVVLVHLSQNQQQNKEEKAETDHDSGVTWDTWRFLSTQTTCGEKYKNSQINYFLHGQQYGMCCICLFVAYYHKKNKKSREENLLISWMWCVTFPKMPSFP